MYIYLPIIFVFSFGCSFYYQQFLNSYLICRVNQHPHKFKHSVKLCFFYSCIVFSAAVNRNNRGRIYGIVGVSVDVICCHEVHEILEIVPTAEVNRFHVFSRTSLFSSSSSVLGKLQKIENCTWEIVEIFPNI